MDVLRIGQVAKRAAVGVETVRFYERKGLLAKPERSASGYRQYPSDAVPSIRFIKRAQEVGFSLDEIKGLLLLRLDSATKCKDIKSRAQAKIGEIEDKITALERMKTALLDLTAACDDDADVSQCAIFRAFEEDIGDDFE